MDDDIAHSDVSVFYVSIPYGLCALEFEYESNITVSIGHIFSQCALNVNQPTTL